MTLIQQSALTAREEKREASPFLQKLTLWSLDFLTAFCILCGFCGALFEILAFDSDLSVLLLIVAADLAVVLLVSRRWYVLPVLLLLAAAVAAALYFYSDAFDHLQRYWSGFFRWIIQGLPKRDPYSYNGSILLVQALAALPLCALVYWFVRRLFSFTLLCAGTLLTAVGLFYYANAVLDIALGFLLAAVVLTLPRFANARLNKTLPAAQRLSRASMQLLGIPAAVLCVCLSFWIVPDGPDVWRSRALSNLVQDLYDYYDYVYNGNSGNFVAANAGNFGYMPLSSRLGGDLELSDQRILSVETDQPFYLKSSVCDTYDGHSWYDGFRNGHFRYGSLLWRNQRAQAFGSYLPVGGLRAGRLYSQMTVEATAKISSRARFLNVYLTPGAVRSLTGTSSQNTLSPYFNLQGELFNDDLSYIRSSYTVDFSILDRSLEGFDQNMLELERLTAGRTDKYYETVCQRYLTLYDDLPQSVYDTAAQITESLTSRYEKAVAIENWLAEHCTYTTTPGTPPEDVDFVAYFLQTREGYCTYYASAMTILARCAGLPARYVTGFGLKQEADALGSNRFIATESSAHAWCEVYFEGIGWIIFDPLVWDYVIEPEAPVERPDAEAASPSLSEEDDGSDSQEDDQDETPEETPLEDQADSVAAVSVSQSLYWATGILAAAAFGWGLVRFLSNHYLRKYDLDRVLRRCKTPEAALDYFYSDVIRQLSFWHVSMAPDDTIGAYCARADRAVVAGTHTVSSLGAALCGARYGLKPVTHEQVREAYFLHDALEAQLRSDLGETAYLIQRVLLSGLRQ